MLIVVWGATMLPGLVGNRAARDWADDTIERRKPQFISDSDYQTVHKLPLF
jgi:hypothetical protein